MKTIFLAHVPADHAFAVRVGDFLRLGCDISVDARAYDDLLESVEDGLASDAALVLLSKDSCPVKWPRDRWEPVLVAGAQRENTEVACLLLSVCPYPALLSRKNFFDACEDPTKALRLIKRWVNRGVEDPENQISPELDHLYREISDVPGFAVATEKEAVRFAAEARQEFDAVYRIPGFERSLAQVVGQLGAQLYIELDRPAEENAVRLLEVLASKRCLVLVDAPSPEVLNRLQRGGRWSLLVTGAPISREAMPETLQYARWLVSGHRYAEAYELLYRLLEKGVQEANCARELAWICEHWDRTNEAKVLRDQYCEPSTNGEQIGLF